jgi:hypothetical protein
MLQNLESCEGVCDETDLRLKAGGKKVLTVGVFRVVVKPLVPHQAGEQPITAAHVQKPRRRRKEIVENWR